ncbi:hypothetical protein BJY01DRAFT_248097 [Aspergillus pseudoustus]|uniref:Spindle pole body-associated protein cut12 domain-containing protein n=1 Tax=Aspergillus pseudoustus TaxID=1810923 RepID=A0ABR4K0D8_9EURO
MADYRLDEWKGKRRTSRTSDYQSIEEFCHERPCPASDSDSESPPPDSMEGCGNSSSDSDPSSDPCRYRDTSYSNFTPEAESQGNRALLGVLRQIIDDPETPDRQKAIFVSRMVSNKGSERDAIDEEENRRREEDIRRREEKVKEREKEIEQSRTTAVRLTVENTDLRARLKDLTDHNEAINAKWPANAANGDCPDSITMKQEQAKIEDIRNQATGARDALEQMKAHIAATNAQLEYAGNILSEYRGKMVDYEQKSDQWLKRLFDYNHLLTLENINLRNRIEEIRNFVESVRQNDTSRWVNALQEAKEAQARSTQQTGSNERLTYGTIDREMPDAFETDTKMADAPEAYIPPATTRIRRRLANVKPRKRAGSPDVQVARPPECRSTISRAAETFLRLGDGKEGKETSPVRLPKKGVVGTMPRKRTRLAKGTDMVRRIEAVADAQRLPTPPKRLGLWYSTNPYDRRNDAELAKMMMGLRVSQDRYQERGIQTEHDHDVKLVTAKGLDNSGFIPREKIWSHPRYLPQAPVPLSKADRKRWTKVIDNWTLGPERAPKKQVRFAKDVDYEPKRATFIVPEKKAPQKPQSKINWSHLLILILMLLLWWSNLGSRPEDKKYTWKMANKEPEEFAAQLRNSHGEMDSRAVRILEFEVGRFSDIDPGVSG